MEKIELCSYIETRGGETYVIILQAQLTADSEHWEFTVRILFSKGEKEIPFKIFNELRTFIIDNNKSSNNLNIVQDVDDSMNVDYLDMKIYLTADLVNIIKESKFMDKYSRSLRKCNFPYGGVHFENILSWKDNYDHTHADNEQTVWLSVEKFQLKNSLKYTLDIRADTTEEKERWYITVELTCLTKFSNSRSILYLSVIDFMALRDFLITWKVIPTITELILPSGRKSEIKPLSDSGIVTRLKIRLDKNEFILPMELVKIIQRGSFIPKMKKMLRKLNYELEPQPNLRWWFFNGKVVIDSGVSRYPDSLKLSYE